MWPVGVTDHRKIALLVYDHDVIVGEGALMKKANKLGVVLLT